MDGIYIWTDEKIQLLKEKYPVSDWDELISIFGTTKEKISSKARKMKIGRDCYNKLHLTDNEIAFIRGNFDKISSYELSKQLGISAKKINQWAKNHGFKPQDGHEILREKDKDEFRKVYPYYSNKELSEKYFTYLTPRQICTLGAKMGVKKIKELSFASPTDEELIDKLRNLYIKIGRFPTFDEWVSSDLSSIQTYKNRFGTIQTACQLADIKFTRYVTGFSFDKKLVQRKDSNGDFKSSIPETTISNILIKNSISFVYDGFYKKYFNIDDFGNKRFDWLIDNKVIEFFGMANKKEYQKKMDEKINLCKKYNIDLLCLYPKDIKETLQDKILNFLQSK